MMVDELDRILGSEERLEPSSGLAAAAMDAVREDARAPAPVPFPWRRLIPGLAICGALLVAGIVLIVRAGVPEAAVINPAELEQFLRTPLVDSCIWTAGSLLATYLLTHLSFRLIIRRI